MNITKPCTLVMFSGGLDSLAVLHLLLSKGERVHVHHVHLHNVEGRAPAEANAVGAVRDYYTRTGKPLDYSESNVHYPSVNGQFFYDTDVTRFMGGYIAARAPVTGVAYGRTADDVADSTLNARTQTGNDIFKVLTDVPMLFPVVHMTKQECYDSLPPALRDLAWSCRRPSYTGNGPLTCGKCKTCRAMKGINRG